MNPNLAFKDLFNSGDFEGLQSLKDASLQTEDGFKFEVHRFLLASRNEYFRNLFCEDIAENKEFIIPDMDAETMDHVLMFLYTGKVSLTAFNVTNILLASNAILANDLMDKCKEFASQNINIDNCLPLFIAACTVGSQSFIDSCYRYVQMNFEEILRKTGNVIQQVSLQALKKFLEDRNLNVVSERIAWMAIVKWVEKNKDERLGYVPELLVELFVDMDDSLKREILEHTLVKKNPYFRNPNMAQVKCWNLVSETHQHPLIKNNPYLQENIAELNSEQPGISLKKCEVFSKDSSRRKRIPTRLNFILYYRMTDGNSHIIQLYLTYDDKLDMWRQIGEVDFWPDSLCRIRQRIYMFNSLEDRRVVFDVCSGSFSDIGNMSIPRLHYKVVSLEDSIYALGGGTDQDETTSVLECYDPETDSWYFRRPMVPVIMSDVVAMDGRIFAIGRDDDGLDSEMKLQVYDPVSDSWSFGAAPNEHRRHFACAVFENNLFVIGGHDEYESLKSTEMYDPSSNIWTTLPNLPLAYIVPKAIVLNQKLLVYEDLYKNLSYGIPNPPVSWNPIENIWEVVKPGSSFSNIYLYQFCEIEEPEILQELRETQRSNVQWIQSSLR